MNIRKTKGDFLKGNANIHGKCLLVSVAVAFVLCVVASVAEFEAGCENVRQNVLRLHVIANSNSDEDQTLKLKVRDAVLEAGEGVFGNGKTSEEAAMMISDNAQLLEDAAEKVITDNGYDYSVSVEVCEDFFPTRTYSDVTLPAGEYTAVKVIIGDGGGKNWWCVMFPPLCLPVAQDEVDISDYLNYYGESVVTAKPKYELRFKVVEWAQKLRARGKG